MTVNVIIPAGESERVLAWVDNNIKRVGAFVAEAFSTLNSTVATCETAEELMEQNVIDQLGKIDHLLMDYDLAGEDGFEKIEKLFCSLQIGKAYVCTGYAHLDVIEEKRKFYSEKLGKEIGLIRKEHLPEVDASDDFTDVSEFLSDLDAGNYLLDSADHNLDTLVDNQTMPNFEEHRRMSLSERIKVLKLGRRLFRSTIDGHFADGSIWLLINGSTGSVVRYANSTADILDQEDVDRIAEDEGFVPLTYSKGWSVDTIDNVCDPRSEMVNYPVLQLKPTNSKKSKVVERHEEIIHYDDGNSFSLIGYEYFLERGWISVLKNPGLREQGDLELVGKEVTLRHIDVRDSEGMSRSREFRAFAVLDWTDKRIALECVSVCGRGVLYPPTREQKICSRRKGLLGRNLKEELNIGITTYPGTSKVRFVKLPT